MTLAVHVTFEGTSFSATTGDFSSASATMRPGRSRADDLLKM
ncbi:hypothetical protein [Bradyrhizobium elkanii]|nr:hypothetical protein [Bradyrhizobium elkanii]